MSLPERALVEDDGQDLVDYGLIVSLAIIGAAVCYKAFATQIGAAWNLLVSAAARFF